MEERGAVAKLGWAGKVRVLISSLPGLSPPVEPCRALELAELGFSVWGLTWLGCQ